MKKNFDRVFKTGDKLQIKIDNTTNKEFHAMVEDVLNEDELLICIDNFSNPIRKHFDGIVYITAFHAEMGIFKMKGFKTSFVSENNYTYIGVKIDHDYNIIQRRQYFRLKILREIEIIAQNGLSMKAMTRDISAGGINFITGLELFSGVHFYIDMKLGDTIHHIEAICLSSGSSRDGRNSTTRAKFVNVNDKSRQKILSSMFNLQRKRRAD